MNNATAQRPKDITEVFDMLPLTERTMMKKRAGYPFVITNDMGHPSWWRVLIDGTMVGIVVYSSGRKLACHGVSK